MSDELIQLVRVHLLSAIAPLGFEITETEAFDSFDNARVVLRSSELRVLVVRERGQILIDFGPPSEPATWFDSDIVLEHLGLSIDGSFSRENAQDALRGAAAFVLACRSELTRLFAEQHLATTKHELKALKERRADRLFGWKPVSPPTA
jgi:hypothetical protein